jgi:hypothetical protein
MRAASKQIHASSHRKLKWNSINWKRVKQGVQELQMRIVKAVREGKLTGRPGHLYAEAGF